MNGNRQIIRDSNSRLMWLITLIFICVFYPFDTSIADYKDGINLGNLSDQGVGDAVYRKGGWLYNHTGIYYKYTGITHWVIHVYPDNVFDPNPYIHVVKMDRLQDFKISNDKYLGAYSSISNLTTDQRNEIISIAEQLRDRSSPILYTWWDQLNGKWGSWDGTIEDIFNLRCDGLVEAAYEMNKIDVWGKNQTHYSIVNYTDEHNDMPTIGLEPDPNTEVCPVVQRGGYGLIYTKLRPSITPVITSVNSGDEVVGQAGKQWITIDGSGFVNEFYATFRDVSNGVTYPIITDSTRLNYISSSQVKVYAGVGTDKSTWSVKITNPGGIASNEFQFSVIPPTSIPTVATVPATNLTSSSATLNGVINNDGGSSILERRFDWGTTPDGSGWTNGTNQVNVSGSSFSYNLTGLNPSTTYYFRARAKNSTGWGMGSILPFTTQPPTPTPTPTPTRTIRLEGDLNFGEVQVGSSAPRPMTIYNDGNSTLNVSSISYSSVSGFSGNWSGVIGAGSSQPVPVTFAPTEAKVYSGDVIVNSDATSGTNTRPVSGTGISISCNYSLSSTSQSFNSSGGNGSVGVTASSSSCSWTATSNAGWIKITSGSSGTGNGTVSYSVSANTGTSTRTGTMTIEGQTFTVTQYGTSTPIPTPTPVTSETVIATVKVGDQPFGVGVNPHTNRIYVSNSTSNNVSVIDGATNDIVGTVAVGLNPVGVGINPQTNRIYVANLLSNNVSVIEGATNNIIATVVVGSAPVFVGVNSQTNRIYISHPNSNSVSVIDGTSNQVVSTVGVGNQPNGVGVNPQTNRIYVANSDSNSVSVIDGATNQVVETVMVEANSPKTSEVLKPRLQP